MNNKILRKKMVRHGECLLMPVDSIPDGAKQTFEGAEYIVAHSETGHHHKLFGGVAVLEFNGDSFLKVKQNSELRHLKSFDFHETKTVFKGLYKVITKRCYDYFAKKIEQVKD